MVLTLELTVFHPRFPEPFEVVAVTGEEALSELFSFHVAFKVPILEEGDAAEAHAFARDALGSRARLRVVGRAAGRRSHLLFHQDRHGMIAAVHSIRVVGNGLDRVMLLECTLVPRAYRLALRKRSRVFQELNVQQIVGTVLAEHQIPFRWALDRKYPRRQYCLQYQETDLAFVTRLFADEGITFYFEHRTAHGADLPHEDPPEDPNEARERVESALETAADVAAGVGGVAQWAGHTADLGWLGVVGGIASLAGDALRGPERDPDTVVEDIPGAGGFDPSGERGDILCFVDRPAAYVRVYPDRPANPDPTVTLHLERVFGLTSTGFEAWDFKPIVRVATGAVELRDHDFRRPLLQLLAQASGPAILGAALHPGGASAEVARLEAYEHHGEHDPPYVTGEEARGRLEQYQSDARTAVGRSPCPLVLPGHVFRLEGIAAAPDAESSSTPLMPAGEYATLRVRHTWHRAGFEPEALGWTGFAHRPGRTADEQAPSRGDASFATGADRQYATEIECLPADVLYRPAIQSRATRATAETAMVVGPPGQEIYTDKHGRVKVQFHWDREGPWSAHSSAFLRVAQPWAGAGFGFQFLPRVGQEVLVTFLGGDPDRPVIMGSLYDGTHPHPEPLPERATRSAIRTQTSPGGGGFHEIVFEDAKDEERLTLRSQRTLEEVAKGPHTVTVGEDQRVLVSGDQQVGVAGKQATSVGGSQSTSVGEGRSESIGGSATTIVGAHRTDRVDGAAVRTVGGLDIQVSEHDDVAVVRGSKSLLVRGNVITSVGGDSESPGNAILSTQGSTYVSSEGSITIRGLTTSGQHPSRITLQVGDSSIAISPQGILITGDLISVVGNRRTILEGHSSSVLTLDGDGALLEGDPAQIRTPAGARLRLAGSHAAVHGGSASVEAGSIALRSGSGPSSSNDPPANEQQPHDADVDIELTHGMFHRSGAADSADASYTPLHLPDMATRIVLDNGSVIKDKRVSGGALRVTLPPAVKEMTVVLDIDSVSNADEKRRLQALYPDGLSFLVKIAEHDLPAATSAEGKRLRLSNLGVATGGDELEGDEMDDVTEAALETFRERQGLTGAEDIAAATTNRLRRLSGET